jgi:hypothetical protein
MDWTTSLAVFGAVTGAASLGWQVRSYWLAGGRVQVLALRERRDSHWRVKTDVVNVGRLDVSIIGYSVWPDVPGYRLRKLRWRVKMVRKAGVAHARRSLVVFSPSVHFSAPTVFEDDERSVELPAVLKAGSMLALPEVGIGWPEGARRRLCVAIHLGSGRIVRAGVLAVDAIRPLEVELNEPSGDSFVQFGRTSNEQDQARVVHDRVFSSGFGAG